MIKKLTKSGALILILSVLVMCLAGCKNKNDVYGAASDFIKVSHPDKPNTNIFSDGSYDNNTSSKSEKSSSEGSSTVSSSEPGTVSSESSANPDQKEAEISSVDSGTQGSTSTKMSSDDQGPVVEFN